MDKITILHSNDIHGRIDGLARIGTLVAQMRQAHGASPVLYFDIGDSEEYANRLSSLTKGAAMHRLLEAAGCDAAVVGNAVMARYGPRAVGAEAAATDYPHLAANIRYKDGRELAGIRPFAVLPAGSLHLGLIGITPEIDNYSEFFDLQVLEVLPLVHELAAQLHRQGVDGLILLSHMGLEQDRELAAALQGVVSLILGGHSHDLLPQGEWIGDILIAQAGEYAQHLGRVELQWDGSRLRAVTATVLTVDETLRPSPEVQAAAERIEVELQEYLGEVICELPQALDFDEQSICGIGMLQADALRHRAGADVAVAIPGPNYTGGLDAGPLRRETLWASCPSTGNPGVVQMSGAQLAALVQRGLDPEFAADRHPALRGHARGLVHLSGAAMRDGRLHVGDELLNPMRMYRVAGTDFEFEPVWGYADETWQLEPRYEVDVILREALDEYLQDQGRGAAT